MEKFVSIGFGNIINADVISVILSSEGSASKKMISEAKSCGLLIDATSGRKTRSVLALSTGQVIACGLNTDTLCARLNTGKWSVADEE